MDAIKKKMLAMKMEKEVATDKAEQTEQSLRDLEDAKNKVRLVQHHFSFFLIFFSIIILQSFALLVLFLPALKLEPCIKMAKCQS